MRDPQSLRPLTLLVVIMFLSVMSPGGAGATSLEDSRADQIPPGIPKYKYSVITRELGPSSIVRISGDFGQVVVLGPSPGYDGLTYRATLSSAEGTIDSTITWSRITKIESLRSMGGGGSPAIAALTGVAAGTLLALPLTSDCQGSFDFLCGKSSNTVLVSAAIGGVLGTLIGLGNTRAGWDRVYRK